MSGCRQDANYEAAIKSGRATIPWVSAFQHLYPDAQHYITHYNIKGGNRSWGSRAYLYGRYEIGMEIPNVTFDASDRNVTGWGQPKFFVVEVTKVDVEKRSIEHGQGVQFGPDKWRDLEAAKGDPSAVGIKVVKTDPVPNFDFVRQED
jgi:hypothetical protein